jgi:hypothetical protein
MLFERSEFHSLPDRRAAFMGTPKGQRLCGRLLLLTFLGEARKVSSRRATPGKSPRSTEVIQPRYAIKEKHIIATLFLT